MRPIDGLICAICGERLVSQFALAPDGVARCGNCERSAPLFERAAAYGSYDAGLRDLIHLLKYEQVRPAAKVLGRMLAEGASVLNDHFGSQPMMVPVPLHRSKLRQRGFNQAELIAREALKHGVLPGCAPQLNASVLERCRPTESQTGLTRPQRRENIRGAFRVCHPELVVGREILLVDDVFTTGTTVSECARILRRAGATKVFVATVARVLKAESTFVEPEWDVAEGPLAMAARV